jgi:predicted small secreted protein
MSMKKAMVAVLAMVLLSSMLLAGCEGVVVGSGKLETKQFNFSDFSQVAISSAFEFEIVQSDSYRVSITADDNLFEHIQVSQTGDTLEIGLKTVPSLGPVTLKAEIAMPELRGLDISGASRGTASGFSSSEDIDIAVSGASSLELVEISAGNAKCDISGASHVTGDITAADVDLTISGASSVQLEGSANDMVANVDGASRMKLAAFPVNNADVKLDGASTGTVNLAGKLDANLDGASKLEYIGEPAMGAINTSGASTLSQK